MRGSAIVLAELEDREIVQCCKFSRSSSSASSTAWPSRYASAATVAEQISFCTTCKHADEVAWKCGPISTSLSSGGGGGGGGFIGLPLTLFWFVFSLYPHLRNQSLPDFETPVKWCTTQGANIMAPWCDEPWATMGVAEFPRSNRDVGFMSMLMSAFSRSKDNTQTRKKPEALSWRNFMLQREYWEEPFFCSCLHIWDLHSQVVWESECCSCRPPLLSKRSASHLRSIFNQNHSRLGMLWYDLRHTTTYNQYQTVIFGSIWSCSNHDISEEFTGKWLARTRLPSVTSKNLQMTSGSKVCAYISTRMH